MEKITYERRKQRGHREAMLEDLPVETVEYRLPAEEQICSCCGGPLHEMSTEVRQELKIIRAQVSVVKHVRYVYACRQCERNEITRPIVIAPMPSLVLMRSMASPSAIAFIATQKYVYGMPLCRQEQQFSRMGLALSRQIQANWMLYASNKWPMSIYETMNEPGRAAELQSYLWIYRTGRDGPTILF